MGRRVCVVGAGRWGKNHIRTLDELGSLAGIVESCPRALEDAKEMCPNVMAFSCVEDAVKEDFDGFTVATPAHTHFEIAKTIIEHKKPVLVEKPMTLKAADTRKLKKLADENGVNLMVGHVLLFHPAVRKIKELTNSGKIGRLEYIYSNRLNLGTVRTEENVIWSFAPHDISIFQYLTEEIPIEVLCRGGAFLQPGIHDTTMTMLTYPNAIVGHIFVSWLHPFKEHRWVVIGSEGMLTYEDASEEKHIFYHEKGIDWVKGEPIKRDGPTEIIPRDDGMPLTEELKYFIEHLDGEPVEIADGQSAVEVLEILERATESLMSGVEITIEQQHEQEHE
ncbi:Gfo/Idh/MocA family protein [Candidatus Hydrogenedentota bacterium]